MSFGQRTIGAYRILGPLGQGGMGVVYRAEHLQSGQPVALKTVKLPRAWLLQSIRREIHALARIRHPGIVRILDEGLHEGMPWYAMELLHGRSLVQHCAELAVQSQSPEDGPPQERSGIGTSLGDTESFGPDWETARARRTGTREISGTPPPAGSRADLRALMRMPAAGGALRPVLGVVRRLCSSLAFLHGEGIVHRDLKPANVLVRPDGMPVLVDFGLATHVGGELSRETLRVEADATGTSHYMAPEQVLRQSVDARADLYALGCILYELVTGQPPFVGKIPGEVLLQHLRAEPRPLSELAEGVPAELDRLVLRLLSKEPRERLGHADDVAAALAELGAEDVVDGVSPRPQAYLYRSGFAGREQSLDLLRRRLDGLPQGKGGLVLVRGESGVGKTRLMVEFGRAAASRGIGVLAGECVDVNGRPLEVFRKPLQALCDRCQERGPEEAERLFGARGPVLAPYEPAIRQLPGQNAHSPPAELSATDTLRRLFHCLGETLSASSVGSGALLLLDDLQWGDELTLSFLEHIAETNALDSVPVLILGAYRSEETTEPLKRLLAGGKVEPLPLGRLQEEAVASMIGDMLALVPPPGAFSRFLADQSEGSPFFVAEYLRAAVEEGLLWRDSGGRWEVADSVEALLTAPSEEARRSVPLPLPRALRVLVGRRLDGLAPEARQLANAAAVLGRDLDVAVLRQMIGMEEAVLFSATHELLRRQVIEDAGEGRLRFAHDKIREVAYEELSAGGRPALHRAAAEAIEAVLVPEQQEQLGELGRHWEEAGERGKASACYLPAARAAVARYALEEAGALYLAYLRLVSEPSLESIVARNELGENVLGQSGRNDEALGELGKALSEAREIGARALEGDSLRRLGEVRWNTGWLEEAREHYEQARVIACQTGNRQGEGLVLSKLAKLYQQQGRLMEAQQLHEQALEIHRQAGNRPNEAIVLGDLGLLHQVQGRLEEAQQLHEQALEIHRQVGARRFEGVVLNSLGVLHIEQGRLEEARPLYEQALEIHRQVGNRPFEGIVLSNLASVEMGEGRLEEARALFEQALAIHRQVGARRSEGILLAGLACVEFLEAADLLRAERLARESERLLEALGERLELGKVLCFQGHFALAGGRGGREQLERAEALTNSGDTGADSPLRRVVDRLRRALVTFEEGQHARLLRGYLPEDLPRGLRQRLELSDKRS